MILNLENNIEHRDCCFSSKTLEAKMKMETLENNKSGSNYLGKFKIAFCILILFGSFAGSFAQGTFTWTGAFDATTWNNAGNWTLGVPNNKPKSSFNWNNWLH
jgi:hypothetical protein